MVIRVVYIILVNNFDPSFFLNTDKILLKIVPPSGKTYSKKGSTNVFVNGAGDKHQVTGTLWISYEGDMIPFHITLKDTKSSCLPKSQYQALQKFKSPVKIMFSFSPNHCVSKEMMHKQIVKIEKK